MNRTIIFLDIDGVLVIGPNTKDHVFEGTRWGKYFCYDFDKQNCANLQSILDEFPEIDLAISSTWREPDLRESLLYALSKRGIDIHRIKGYTPILDTRGEEIQAWLEENPYSRYIIIDDTTDWFNPEQLRHTIKTTFKTGLTCEITEEIKKLLRSTEESRIENASS